MAAFGWGRLKPKLQCRLMYTSAHNCALAHSSATTCVGLCKKAKGCEGAAMGIWQMHELGSQCDMALPDVGVGNFLRRGKKILTGLDCSIYADVGNLLRRRKIYSLRGLVRSKKKRYCF